VVFSRGRPIAEDRPEEIRNDPVVLDAYLGDDWRPPAVRRANAGTPAGTGPAAAGTAGDASSGPGPAPEPAARPELSRTERG
jgi:Branched-chain amino acid ATP-binding cassette transporter